jgi:hypothetical protein
MEAFMLTVLAALLASATPPATSPAAPAATAATDPGKVVKCRKLPVTGSLARFTRECRTVAEWARLDGDNRESATKIQERGLVVGCGSSANGC